MNSVCPHCKGIFWELHTEEPQHCNFKVNFIRCSKCKAPVGVMDFFDTHTKLEKIEKLVGAMGTTVTSALNVIDQNIRRLFLK